MTMKVVCHDGECHYADKKLSSDCKDCDILDGIDYDQKNQELTDDF